MRATKKSRWNHAHPVQRKYQPRTQGKKTHLLRVAHLEERVDNIKHLVSFWRRRQVLMTILRHQDAILDAHPTDVIVFVQHLLVNILGMRRDIEEEGLDVVPGEVADETSASNRHDQQRKSSQEVTHIPGSMVTTISFSSTCL
jgi:hypothetical protein